MPTVKRSSTDVDLTGFDWSKVDATSEEDIARQIASDPDTAPDLSATSPSDVRRVHPTSTRVRMKRAAR